MALHRFGKHKRWNRVPRHHVGDLLRFPTHARNVVIVGVGEDAAVPLRVREAPGETREEPRVPGVPATDGRGEGAAGPCHKRGFVYWRSRNDGTRAYIFVDTLKQLVQIAPL